MYEEGTKKAALQVAAMLERLLRMSDSMEARHRQATEQQQRTVQLLPGVLREAAEQTLGHIATDAASTTRMALVGPVAEAAQRAAEHERLMRASTDAMVQTQRRLAGVVHKALWVVTGVLAILVPVVALGGYLGWHYRQVIAQYQIEADVLRAYNQADVRLCGGRLCARVDRADRRYGDYVPVKLR